MQGIPQAVTEVSVYPYIDWPPNSGLGPVILPVIEGATGTYQVSTLITNVFYNLDLTNATLKAPLHLGGKYTATFTMAGSPTNTTWMYCTDASVNAKFGRTVSMTGPAADVVHAAPPEISADTDENQLIQLAPVDDLSVSQPFGPPPIVGTRLVIQDASGHLVATRTGTPHLTGFSIADPDGKFEVGMKNLTASGKNAETGQLTALSNLTCVSVGTTAVLLQTFP